MRNAKLVTVAASILLFGCSSTNTVTIPVQEPPLVILPPEMTRLGVIDRTSSEEYSRILATIDDAFSLKGPELDSLGAEAGLSGLLEELARNPRLAEIKLLSSAILEHHTYGALPAPISWSEIDVLCSHHDLDGLLSLEFYETDTRVEYSTRKVTREGPLNVELPLLEHHAAVETIITTGWRIYDRNGRNMVDELVMEESVVTTGRGVNPAKAVRAVTSRSEAVRTLSGDLGRRYARRLLPYRSRVTRDYYVRGHDDLKLAKRRAQTGNWEGAAELWLTVTDHRKARVAARAHYNMAIISEIRGDLDQAVEWARVAYEDYGDERAMRYLRALQERRERVELL